MKLLTSILFFFTLNVSAQMTSYELIEIIANDLIENPSQHLNEPYNYKFIKVNDDLNIESFLNDTTYNKEFTIENYTQNDTTFLYEFGFSDDTMTKIISNIEYDKVFNEVNFTNTKRDTSLDIQRLNSFFNIDKTLDFYHQISLSSIYRNSDYAFIEVHYSVGCDGEAIFYLINLRGEIVKKETSYIFDYTCGS